MEKGSEAEPTKLCDDPLTNLSSAQLPCSPKEDIENIRESLPEHQNEATSRYIMGESSMNMRVDLLMRNVEEMLLLVPDDTKRTHLRTIVRSYVVDKARLEDRILSQTSDKELLMNKYENARAILDARHLIESILRDITPQCF